MYGVIETLFAVLSESPSYYQRLDENEIDNP